MPTLFKSLAEMLEKVEATKKRTETVRLVSDFLRTLEPEELEPAVSMILGRAFTKWSQKTLDLSWTTLNTVLRRITQVDWSVFTEAFTSTGDIGSATKALFENTRVKRQTQLIQKQLTINDVRTSIDSIAATSGSGSKQRKERLTEALFSQATPAEAKYLVKILTGEMRTGFHEGLMEQATAKAFGIPLDMAQNASMALGDVGEAAVLAQTGGEQALANLGFKVFRPAKPMLAQVADNIDEALKIHDGEIAFEYKYDGARVQIHKLGDEVRVFSRRLTDATQSLPEIVETVKRNIEANEAILEGEVIATDASGFPIPFQHLMRRFKRVHGIADSAEKIPLQLYMFDILHLNGENLIRLSYAERRRILSENAGNIPLTKQIVTSNKATANKFLKEAVNAGHEGLMAKKLDSPYTGTRGKRWLKIKTVLEPLDLVITAAEYGYGRRHGWLSNYYLSARDAETGEYLDLGKTFKGLTDAEIIEMTKRLKELAVSEDRWRVIIQPKIVVEVTYNEIQRSPTYKSQMALRFARITRIRDDKAPEDADTIQRVREIYEKQFAKKGRYKTE